MCPSSHAPQLSLSAFSFNLKTSAYVSLATPSAHPTRSASLYALLAAGDVFSLNMGHAEMIWSFDEATLRSFYKAPEAKLSLMKGVLSRGIMVPLRKFSEHRDRLTVVGR